MQTALLIGHLLLALLIIAMVLLQRSEGGALGIGGGDGLKSGRAPTNPLVRLTTILGFCFFVSSIALTLLAKQPSSVIDAIPQTPQPFSAPPVGGLDK